MSPKSDKPVFVIGVFRSGTSLLYALLNQHPDIALMYEADFWNLPDSLSSRRLRRNWLERQEFYNQALSRHRLIFGDSLRGLENHNHPDKIYREFSDGKGAAVFGEKSPFYCLRLRQLARRYPGAPFILIWRNPVEVYRSTVDAGRKVPFFRQPGMRDRLIAYQEEMIRQSAVLERNGGRVFHIAYDDLVDQTETVCRGICEFLDIPFDPKMVQLKSADLSAVYRAANFDHLRRGVIERRQSTTILPPHDCKKLQRYHVRWNRLTGNRFKNSSIGPEPSIWERVADKIAGSFWVQLDNVKRMGFEYLPIPWLRTYRVMKKWLGARRAELPADHRSVMDQVRAHWLTILASMAGLALIATLDFYTGPYVSLLPLYLFPCALLTLVINSRWGTAAALVASAVWCVFQAQQNPSLYAEHWGILLWNGVMRFLLLQIFVLLLNRVRVEASLTGESR